jgi:tetratricopeptide (TPR) repeat protein
MEGDFLKDIVEKLNQDVVCNEYILEIEQGAIKENGDYKSVEKYIKPLKNMNIDVEKENIDELNKIICTDSSNSEVNLKTDLLLYINRKNNKIYFYSFQGFSEEFLNTYKKMEGCSFLRYLFDGYFKDNCAINNIEDYIAIKLREYVNSLADKINNNDCSQIQQYSNNLYDEINYISTLTYEGSNVSAKIVLLKESLFCEYIDFYIKLEDPIKFEEYRKVRKLLETSDKNIYLIGDNEKIYGLGRFKNINEFKDKMNIFIIDFLGRFEYKINTLFSNFSIVKEDIANNSELIQYSLEEHILVNVRCGKPDLKEYRYSERDFCAAVKKIFKDEFKVDSDKKIETLKKIISCAKDQKHGTTVVITTPDKAREEILKLEKQSIKIKEKQLKDDKYLANIINRITNIDGALYLDTNGKCHAIGVILDGVADNEHGDAARGARFNSAIKYSLKETIKEKCIIVVMSEDGMVNIIYNGDNYNKNSKIINELINEAEKLYNNNEFDKLIEKSDEILAIDENNVKAYSIKGLAIMNLGKNEEALEYYEKSIELDSDNYVSYVNKGNAFANLKKIDEAIECYNKAIEINTNCAVAYNNKGNALNRLKKNKEAIKYLDRAIEIDSDYANAYLGKGNALKALGKDEEAKVCYQIHKELTENKMKI